MIKKKKVKYKECLEHDKSYSYPWICRKCGEEGRDRGVLAKNDYADIKRKFNTLHNQKGGE